MSPLEKRICEATEPHRKSIGWTSFSLGVLLMFCTMFVSILEHNNATREKVAATKEKETAFRVRGNITRLEDSIRDMLVLSERGLVILYAGEKDKGERVVGWSSAAEKLLGWTLDDMKKLGIKALMPSEKIWQEHQKAMERSLWKPLDERKTSVVHCRAKTKSGDIIPVRITAWVVGDHTRSVAAYIEKEASVSEQVVQ